MLNTLATNGYTAQGETIKSITSIRRIYHVIVREKAIGKRIRFTHLRPVTTLQADVALKAAINIATTHETLLVHCR